MTIKKRCQEIKEYFLNKITLAEQTQDRAIISVVCLSILDCLAQESSNSPIFNNQKSFIDFVKKYGDSNILDCVNYVTLYYANIEKFNLQGIYINQILSSGCVYTLPEVCEIFRKISTDTTPYKELKNHNLSNQLWFYRNKVMHEHNTLSYDISKNTSWIPDNVPYFYSYSSKWVFCIPTNFIKELLIRCLENYLRHCEECDKDPFKNNNSDRSIYLSWVN